MRKDCMKRFAAWLLAALLAISPALAEPVDAMDAMADIALAVDAVVLEDDAADLGGDDPTPFAEEPAPVEEGAGNGAMDGDIPADGDNPVDGDTPVDDRENTGRLCPYSWKTRTQKKYHYPQQSSPT